MVKEIEAYELNARMQAGEDIHLVDIRSATELTHGVLPNAIHLPMHLIPVREGELPQDKDVVLYCRSGARSYHACVYLQQKGLQNILHLRGGISSWARNGHEIAPGLPN